MKIFIFMTPISNVTALGKSRCQVRSDNMTDSLDFTWYFWKYYRLKSPTSLIVDILSNLENRLGWSHVRVAYRFYVSVRKDSVPVLLDFTKIFKEVCCTVFFNWTFWHARTYDDFKRFGKPLAYRMKPFVIFMSTIGQYLEHVWYCLSFISCLIATPRAHIWVHITFRKVFLILNEAIGICRFQENINLQMGHNNKIKKFSW